MDDDKLIHFMIVSADYVLDTVSKYEPDEYYLSKLTCKRLMVIINGRNNSPLNSLTKNTN